jgi:hypothetical protein
MIYSQIFHRILSGFLEKKCFEKFNISENNIINVELGQVGTTVA